MAGGVACRYLLRLALRAITVELEHRRLKRLVGGQALRDGITGGGGWVVILELFAKAATNEA